MSTESARERLFRLNRVRLAAERVETAQKALNHEMDRSDGLTAQCSAASNAGVTIEEMAEITGFDRDRIRGWA